MHFIGTMGQRLMIGLPRVLGKILAIGVLLAVPTLGLARLSGDLLTSWQSRNADDAASVQNALDGLLAFDAPASTYRQHQLRNNDSSSSRPGEGATKPSLLAEDWRFTAATPPDLTSVINGYLNTIVRDQLVSDLLLLNAGVPTNIVTR